MQRDGVRVDVFRAVESARRLKRSSDDRIEGIPSSRSLSQIKELCERLGNGELPLPNEVPQDYVDALNKKHKPQYGCGF